MNVSFLLVGKNEHTRLATLMVRSLRKAMPQAHITQQTDLTTARIAGVDRVERLRWNGIKLMTYRLKHLANLSEPTLVLDVDVLVQRDVSEIEQIPGDVVLTPREYKEGKKNKLFETMPYNTGVMFMRNPAFFTDCFEWCRQASREIQRWGGDQLAVAAVVNSGKFKVATMPCPIYNYSPRTQKDEVTPGAAIVHYKGLERKLWMMARKI